MMLLLLLAAFIALQYAVLFPKAKALSGDDTILGRFQKREANQSRPLFSDGENCHIFLTDDDKETVCAKVVVYVLVPGYAAPRYIIEADLTDLNSNLQIRKAADIYRSPQVR